MQVEEGLPETPAKDIETEEGSKTDYKRKILDETFKEDIAELLDESSEEDDKADDKISIEVSEKIEEPREDPNLDIIVKEEKEESDKPDIQEEKNQETQEEKENADDQPDAVIETKQEPPNTPQKRTSTPSNGIMSLNTLMLSPKPPKTPQREPTTPRSPRYSSRSVEIPEDTPEIRRYKDLALELKPLPNLTDEIYDQIVASLSHDRKIRAQSHKFKDGQKLTAAIDHVRKYQLELRKQGLQKEAESNFQRELEEFKQIQENFDNETKEMVSKLKSKLDEQGKRIKASHQKELEDHQALWKSDAKIRQYNRASNRLVSLRKQLNLMLVQCRFDEAEQMEKVVFEQKSLEEAESHRQMQHAYNEATKKLLAKQESEWDFYLTSSSVQMQQLVQKRAKLRRQIENKQKRIDAKAEVVNDREKLWNKIQTQRLEELSAGTQNKLTLPSTKMSRKDITDEDQTTLTLPPLNFSLPSPGKSSSRRK